MGIAELTKLSNMMYIQGGFPNELNKHLFALYTEMIMREIEDMVGFRIGGKVVNNLRSCR